MVLAIQQHAIDRFRQKTGCKKSDDYIIRKLFSILDKSTKTDFVCSEFKVAALLNHGFRDADYYKFVPKWGAEFILVVENGVLKTMHFNESGRFK